MTTPLRILLTTTSFQDTPGPHHDKLAAAGVELICERGPLTETQMLALVGGIDGMICGDDAITAAVIDRALPRLQVISKYGIGLDKIDLDHATERGVPVTFCPGVNHTTVAEHVFALMLALVRNLVEEVNFTRAGEWKRLTGHELMGKQLGILGLGRIGREVALRAVAFGMKVAAHDIYWPREFAEKQGITRVEDLKALLQDSEVVSLHTNLTDETRHLIDAGTIALMKPGALLINCARGELVETPAVVSALETGHLGGYGTDVLDAEPPPADHPLLRVPRCLVTPHIGSRTFESVERQAGMAVDNLLLALSGQPPLAQANKVPLRDGGEA